MEKRLLATLNISFILSYLHQILSVFRYWNSSTPAEPSFSLATDMTQPNTRADIYQQAVQAAAAAAALAQLQRYGTGALLAQLGLCCANSANSTTATTHSVSAQGKSSPPSNSSGPTELMPFRLPLNFSSTNNAFNVQGLQLGKQSHVGQNGQASPQFKRAVSTHSRTSFGSGQFSPSTSAHSFSTHSTSANLSPQVASFRDQFKQVSFYWLLLFTNP